jgi:hypothetical protein
MATDFFDREARAQKQTRRLIWLFGSPVLAVLVVNNLLLDSLVCCFSHPVLANGPPWHPFSSLATTVHLIGEALVYPPYFLKLILPWQTAVWITLETLISIAVGCLYKMHQLSHGGAVVAEYLGGRCIETGTTGADEQRLRNVVGEMAIASGTSVREIYVLDHERGINSFAAGPTHDDVAHSISGAQRMGLVQSGRGADTPDALPRKPSSGTPSLPAAKPWSQTAASVHGMMNYCAPSPTPWTAPCRRLSKPFAVKSSRSRRDHAIANVKPEYLFRCLTEYRCESNQGAPHFQ